MPSEKLSALQQEVEELRVRLADAEEVIRAIRHNEVDAVVVQNQEGFGIYTLEGAEHPYRVMVEAMSEGAASLSTEGVILYANQQLADLLRRPLTNVIGSQLCEYIVDSDQNRCTELLASAQSGPCRSEFQLRAEDGVFVPVYLALNPLPLEQERCFTLVATNLTDQKAYSDLLKSEAALRESEQRLQLAAQAAHFGTYDFDLVAGTCYWSPELKSICGQNGESPAVATPLDVLTLTHPDDRERVREALELSCDPSGDGDFSQEHRIVQPDGTVRWVFVSGRTLFHNVNNELRAVRMTGTVLDITQRKQLEEEREQLLQREQQGRVEAENSSRLKDEFLATVSHELRSPLNTILGWASMLRAGDVDRAMIMRGLDTIERNAKTQAQLIEDLLDVSGIISGKYRLTTGPVYLPTTIQAAIESVQHAAQAKEVHIDVQLEPLAAVMNGDATRLQQVVWNLVSNAVKFTPPGGRVQVLLRRKGDHAEIAVSDTGQGIDPQFLPYIFERFRQADGTSTRRHGGLGLGLTIARHLVEMHGGTVEADSAGLGKGATFIVRLPLLTANEPAPAVAGAASVSENNSTSDKLRQLAGLRILAADDEPDSREMLQGVLEQWGAEVVITTTADEALEQLPETQPHILIFDIGMPETDGYSLIQHVRALPPERGGSTPAIALTGYVTPDERVRALSAGYDVFLPKPLQVEELAQAIADLAREKAVS